MRWKQIVLVIKRTGIVLLLLAVILFVINANATAKDYSFPRVRITVHIEKSGSFLLIEERTYRFSGEFRWATYTLAKTGFSGLEDFSVADEAGPYRQVMNDEQKPGTFILTENDDAYSVRFYYHAADAEKTFTFTYRIHGAIKVYEDTADFYWKLIGTGWEKKTGVFEAAVYLPEEVEPERLYVFGHGPLHGLVERAGGSGAVFRLNNLPPNKFVEARILFPPEILNVPRIKGSRLKEFLAEERELARLADAQKKRNVFLTSVLAAVPVVIFLFWAYLFFKFGREYKPAEEILYTRDIPENLPPAIVGYLMRFKKVTSADFTATIMNLIRKGYITLEAREEEKGLIFKKKTPVVYFSETNKKTSDLLPHEKIVYDFLFSAVSFEDVLSAYPGKTADFARRFIRGRQGKLSGLAGEENEAVSTEDIKKYVEKHPGEFSLVFETFKQLVNKEAEAKNFFDREAERWMIVFGIFAIAVSVLCIILAAVSGLLFFFPVYIISIVVFVLLIFPLARRTRTGAESFARWKGLKKFLKDFSDMKTAPPASIAIWEHYLVYSVTFGISKKVLKQLKLALAQFSKEEVMGSAFFAEYSGGRTSNLSVVDSFSGFVNTMVSSFNSISSAASSTGGGGGFSGGGGGGGGGSGGGAG